MANRTASLLGGDYRQMVKRGHLHGEGERKLVVAVMTLAVQDLRTEGCRKSIQRWAESPLTVPFSFLWCCRVMGFTPDITRKRFLNQSLFPQYQERRFQL